MIRNGECHLHFNVVSCEKARRLGLYTEEWLWSPASCEVIGWRRLWQWGVRHLGGHGVGGLATSLPELPHWAGIRDQTPLAATRRPEKASLHWRHDVIPIHNKERHCLQVLVVGRVKRCSHLPVMASYVILAYWNYTYLPQMFKVLKPNNLFISSYSPWPCASIPSFPNVVRWWWWFWPLL